MNATKNSMLVLAAALLVLEGVASGQAPLGTAFTYQGRLNRDGTPVNGSCAFSFSVWDGASDPFQGQQIGPTLIFDGAPGNLPKGPLTCLPRRLGPGPAKDNPAGAAASGGARKHRSRLTRPVADHASRQVRLANWPAHLSPSKESVRPGD